MHTGFIPAHGGYRNLLSYRKAECIYDLTWIFCKRFLSRRDRTLDQMVQAARSGKQNIAEASRSSGTSTETEIRLTNVARASLEELRLDYEDFLRTRAFRPWDKDSREGRYVRELARTEAGCRQIRAFSETRSADIVANIALCLIHQANFLLDRQIRRLERDFLENGGVRERMTRLRREHRKRGAS